MRFYYNTLESWQRIDVRKNKSFDIRLTKGEKLFRVNTGIFFALKEWKGQIPSATGYPLCTEVFAKSKCRLCRYTEIFKEAWPVTLQQRGWNTYRHSCANKIWYVLKQWLFKTFGFVLWKMLQYWALVLFVLGTNPYSSSCLYATFICHKRMNHTRSMPSSDFDVSGVASHNPANIF